MADASTMPAEGAQPADAWNGPGAQPASVAGDRMPFMLFLAAIAWVSVPLGSNRPWAWYLLAAVVFGCVAWWCVLAARSAAVPGLSGHRAPLLLWLGWAVYPLVQVMPIPGGLLELVSPAAYNVQAYGRGLTHIPWGTLSVDRGETLAEFIKHAAYLGMLFLTVVLLRDRARVKAVLALLLIVGAAQAAVGLTSRFLGLDLFWWDPTASGAETITVRGTFVNRNHFAALLVMCGAAGLGLIMSRLGPPRKFSGLRERAIALMDGLLDWRAQPLVLVVLIFAGLFFSASRGASLGLIVAFAATVALALLFRGRHTPEVRFVPFVAAAALIAVIWLGAAPLAERALSTDLRADERLVQWELSLPLAKDYIGFGVGAGNYGEVFSLYRDSTLRPLTYDRAHSDWLELLIDHGIVGALILIAALVATYRVVLTAYRKRRDLLARGALFASLLGTIAMIVHGALDFVFQIPATAACFFVLLGIGLVAARLPHEARDPSQTSRKRSDNSVSTPSQPPYGWKSAAAPAQDVPLDDL